METDFDVIVLGTGLTECILSGLLSVEGKKVLHLDRNDYYGSATASLHLEKLYAKFKSDGSVPEGLGKDREFNVDLIPKFAMASGEFVDILYHTDVTRYIEFRQIAGSYVYTNSQLSKVPSTTSEALLTPLLTLPEKHCVKSFFEYIQTYDSRNPETWQGLDLATVSMKDVYEKFGVEERAREFIGHAVALHLDDGYMDRCAMETYERICLYINSMARFGKSPYVYPVYGLGELPQGFARLSAIHGGTYILNKPVAKLAFNNETGAFEGVECVDGDIARANVCIADPSYVSDRVKQVGRVVRVICLLNHPVPGTDDVDSAQIVIPQKQAGRSHDIHIAVISSAHKVASPGHFIAIVSTLLSESDVPCDPESEVSVALNLLGPIVEKFVHVDSLYEPLGETTDGVFVSKSYDATSHFESALVDVKRIYKGVMGADLKVEGKVVKVLEE